jgi:hypothetical protein
MQIAGYEFADGARFQPGAQQDPKEVGAHLEMLREKFKGELTPKDVLDDARNNNSPLHSFFEWDEGAAAEQYRLQQARGLIRSVVAIYTHTDQPATRVRAYVHVPEAGAPHYRDTKGAMSQAKTRDLVLQRAWRELSAWRARYRDLKQLADLFGAIDETAKKLPKTIREA